MTDHRCPRRNVREKEQGRGGGVSVKWYRGGTCPDKDQNAPAGLCK